MNHYVVNNQHNALATPREDGNLDQKGTVICPKPKRIQVQYCNIMQTRPLRWKFCEQGEGYCDSNSNIAGEELLDIIQNHEASLSPPYFLGSPPVRASNPLIQDAQFGCEKQIPHQSTSAVSSSPSSSASASASASPGLSSPSSPLRKGGCVRMKFGAKSAKVRVVGFDCHFPAVAY